MQNVRVHLFIYGDVIGVGFRDWVVREANKIGVVGWVKNASDCVESIIEGKKVYVDSMIKKCHEGPMTGYVDRVDVSWEEYTGQYKSFTIIR